MKFKRIPGLLIAAAIVLCMASSAVAVEDPAEALPYNMSAITIPLSLSCAGANVSGTELTFDAAAAQYALSYTITADMTAVKTLYNGLVQYVGNDYADICTLTGSFTMSITFPADTVIDDQYRDSTTLKADAQTQLADSSQNANLGVFLQIDSASMSGNTLTIAFSYKAGMNGLTIRMNNGLPLSMKYITPAGMVSLPAVKYKDGTLVASGSCGANITVGITNKDNYQTSLATKIKNHKASSIQAVRDAVNALFPTDPPDAIESLEIPLSGTSGNTLNMKRPEKGSLKITKTLSGSGTDAGKTFDITVMIADMSVTGTYGGLVFNEGCATVSLKGGESVTADDLPNNVEYTVTEADYTADGYTSTSVNASGTILGGSTVCVEFVNAKNAPSEPESTKPPVTDTETATPPSTGDTDEAGVFAVAALILSGAALRILSKKASRRRQ